MDQLIKETPLSYTIATTAVVLTGIFYLFRRRCRNKMSQIAPIKDQKKDVVYLYQFAYVDGENPSPFCLKLESFLKVNRIPFEIVKGSHILSAPRGKLPFIQLNGQIISDSEEIINVLSEKYEIKVDDDLSDEQKAQSVAIKRIVENHLFYVILHYRWIDEEGWNHWCMKAFSKGFVNRNIISKMARSRVKKVTFYQGVSGYTDEERIRSAKEDLDALSIMLGDKQFMVSSKFSVVDASVYGCLKNMKGMHECQLRDLLLGYENLVKYIERIDEMINDYNSN